MTFPEPGYTPANLRALIESRGWTQEYAASLIGISRRTMLRWLADVDAASHTDMPLKLWIALMNAARNERFCIFFAGNSGYVYSGSIGRTALNVPYFTREGALAKIASLRKQGIDDLEIRRIES